MHTAAAFSAAGPAVQLVLNHEPTFLLEINASMDCVPFMDHAPLCVCLSSRTAVWLAPLSSCAWAHTLLCARTGLPQPCHRLFGSLRHWRGLHVPHRCACPCATPFSLMHAHSEVQLFAEMCNSAYLQPTATVQKTQTVHPCHTLAAADWGLGPPRQQRSAAGGADDGRRGAVHAASFCDKHRGQLLRQ